MSAELGAVQERPAAPVEFRSVADFEVRWADRTIELVAIPYDSDADVFIHGRPCKESCDPAAFRGVEGRANRVKVNRDHDYRRTIGRATNFYPSRAEGLVAKLRIARTELGDESLALAEDHSLEASVGFQVHNERWFEGRARRRLLKCFLDHVSLVPEGAYDAQVLDVRGAVVTPAERLATPNLDEVLGWYRSLTAHDSAVQSAL